MTGGPPPRALLFDLDGTLVDTFRLYLESYSRALEPYLGRRPTVGDFHARVPASERRFLVDWLGEADGHAAHLAMVRHYAELHAALCEGVYDGVPEMLEALRAAGWPLGIVTGKGRRGWEVTERELALGPFAVVVTDDDVDSAKPDPSGLLLAARALGVAPAECVYVGDSLGDLAAGRHAGMRAAAALGPKTGEGERERFLKEAARFAPDRVFERPADVTRAFAAWC